MDATAIDRILIELNPFGRVQILFVVSSAYIQFFLPMTGQSINFLAATPSHHCTLRDGYLLNQSVPIEEVENGDTVYSQCLEYSNPDIRNSTRECQNGWEYETDVYGETIISEWDLVCDQNAVAEISQSVLQVGGFIGAFVFGILADRYGRRPSFLLALFLYALFGIVICFSPNYTMFVIIRFFCGFSQMAVWVCFSSNISEYMIPKYRNRAMTVPAISFSFGLMFMTLLAFLIRDWRYFQLAIISPVAFGLCGMWFLPESLRWLSSKGRTKATDDLIRKLAKQNGSEVPKIIYDAKPEHVHGISTVTEKVEEQTASKNGEVIHLNLSELKKERTFSVSSDDITTGPVRILAAHDTYNISLEEERNRQMETPVERDTKTKGYNYFDLFKPPVLHVTLVLGILRLSYTMVYFGFALSTGRLAGDPYLNFFYSALVEVPARFLAPVVYNLIRRTYTLSICFFACAASLILIIFIPDETKEGVDLSVLKTVLSLTGKFFVVLTLAGLMLLVIELYPTTIRNNGNGFTLCLGRIGAILAPFMLYADEFRPNFSLITMASLSVVTAFSVLTLPDTRTTSQPQTSEDLRQMMKSKGRKKEEQGHQNEAFKIENSS